MNIQKRVAEIFKAESQAILSIPITPSFEKAVKVLKNCKGKVLTTGMGKAGHIARKCAGTLCSTGTPAAFIHPGEAAHGDLGLIDKDDCIIAFSDSGKTKEILEMLTLGKHIGLKTIIGVTAHPESDLRNLSDIVLDMGKIKESCKLDLTPTSSIVVMLAIADALSLVLMELKGITKHDFGLRHHGGYLGRKARLDNE